VVVLDPSTNTAAAWCGDARPRKYLVHNPAGIGYSITDRWGLRDPCCGKKCGEKTGNIRVSALCNDHRSYDLLIAHYRRRLSASV
jgi:hypothetical protein